MKSCKKCNNAKMCKHFEKTEQAREVLYDQLIGNYSTAPFILFDKFNIEMYKSKAEACSFYFYRD